MKYLLLIISLTLFFSFIGGFVGSIIYNQAMTKQVLGTTTAAPEPIEENMRVDHNETSITYPKIYKMEKVTNNKAEYVKLTNDNKVVVIEKDTSTPKQIEKDLDCTNKPNCKKAVKGANTYTNIQTEDTDAYMAARDNEFVVIKFVNVDTPTKDIILTSFKWL